MQGTVSQKDSCQLFLSYSRVIIGKEVTRPIAPGSLGAGVYKFRVSLGRGMFVFLAFLSSILFFFLSDDIGLSMWSVFILSFNVGFTFAATPRSPLYSLL